MEKTHYEKMLGDPQFYIQKVFDLVEPELNTDTFTWEQFNSTKIMQELHHSIKEMGAGQQDVVTTHQMLFHQYAFYKGSQRVYDVREGIAEMLLNTKLDMDTQMIKSPFPEIILSVPVGLLQIKDPRTGAHDIWNIYVNFQENSDTDKIIKVLCVGKPNTNSKNEYDDSVFYFKVHLTEGKISESLKREMGDWEVNPIRTLLGSDNDTQLMPRLFHFVLNILLYITSPESDVTMEASRYKHALLKLQTTKSAQKIEKMQRRIDQESRFNSFVVGGSLQLSSEEIGILKEHGRHGVRYPVGGHWRLQWYGHKEAQVQKPKWIRPHLRGPELAELIKSVGIIK